MRSGRVRTLLVMQSLMVFNGVLFAIVGWILLIFMSKPAGLVGAVLFWLVATGLWEGSSRINRLLPLDGRRR